MKIAVIGGTGMLGSNLVKLYCNLGHEVEAFSRSHASNIDSSINCILNFSNLELILSKCFQSWVPDVIINTAAIVNLSYCENNLEQAREVNVGFAKILAKVAQQYKSYFIHISTDHFYDDHLTLHRENDEETLLNNYALTKREAEKEVLHTNKLSLVVRTNIIGFRYTERATFLEWLLNALKKQEIITLFDDYYSSPISAKKLGEILLGCIDKKINGIYNIASADTVSKYFFGLTLAKRFNLSQRTIRLGSLKELNEKSGVRRSFNNGLDVNKIESALSIKMPTVLDSIEQIYQEYTKVNEIGEEK